MKRLLTLLMLFTMTLGCAVGCDALAGPEDKDVSLLLAGLGNPISSIEALGDLPEPEVQDSLQYYDNTGAKDFFRGFNLGVELDDDGLVQRIYVKPYGEHVIRIEGLRLGAPVSEADALFGAYQDVETVSGDQTYRYRVYTTEAYDIKCTLDGDFISAVSFSAPGLQTPRPEPEHTLSAVWTQQEVQDRLGDDFEMVTEEMVAYFDYHTTVTYDDGNLEYGYYHDRYPFNSVNVADNVSIRSAAHVLAGLDVQVGDDAKTVYALCAERFERAWDPHGDEEIFDTFLYREEGKSTPGGRTTWWLSFSMEPSLAEGERLTSIEQIPDGALITGIHLWTPLD